MSQDFRYQLRVRYGECDAQKVVFNARYGEYVELAVTEFLRALGFGAELISGELDYQLVKQTMEWKAPARFDQVLSIGVVAAHLGNTSFSLRCTFHILGQSAAIASAETVYVMVDAATLTKKPLPAHFRTALQNGAPNHITDHAGLR